jgi:hypothetical protein
MESAKTKGKGGKDDPSSDRPSTGENAEAPFTSVQSQAADFQLKELGPRDVGWEEELFWGRHQGVVGASRRV